MTANLPVGRVFRDGLPESGVLRRLFQVDHDVAADLLQRYFAQLGVVLRREDALLGVQQALLRLAHFDARQVAQQVAFHGDLVILLGGDQVLLFEQDHFEVVPVSLPEIRQVGAQ